MIRFPTWAFVALLLAGLAALPTAAAGAEAPEIAPGSPNLDGSRLEPFRATTDWGSLTVAPSELNGHKVLNVINLIQSQSTVMTDHTVLDRASLALIYRFSPYFAVGEHYLVAMLEGPTLSAALHPLAGGEPVLRAGNLGSPVFEEATLGLILAALPLDEAFEATLPKLGIHREGAEFFAARIHAKVVGRETVKGGDGHSYPTWVVEAEWEGVDHSQKMWIADRPPYEIKRITSSGGRKRTSGFKRVELLD